MIIGPKQIEALEALVDSGNFVADKYKEIIAPQQQQGKAPPPPPPPGPKQQGEAPPPPPGAENQMSGAEKRAKLTKILAAIDGLPGFDKAFGMPEHSMRTRLKFALFTAFGVSGKDAITPAEMPAMRDLYIEFIFDVLNKANFGDAGTAQGKRDEFSGKIRELLHLLPRVDDNTDADLISLGETIRKHGNTSNAGENIQRKITEISEKFKSIALRQAALRDPVLGPKIQEYRLAKEEFIHLHAQLRHDLDDGMSEDDLVRRREYKRLQEIAALNAGVQAEAAKAAWVSALYTSFLNEEEKKRTSDLNALQKEKSRLLEKKKAFDNQLLKIPLEDIAQISNIEAYKQSVIEKLAVLQKKIDYLDFEQEEEKARKDEIDLFSKLNALWLADEKSEGSKKAQHGWKDAFQSAYQAMTGHELSNIEFLALKEKLKAYNHELQTIVEAADFRTQPWQEKYRAVSAVNQKYQDIIGGDFTEHLLAMAVRKFSEKESTGARDVPKLKSTKYLQAKIDFLKKEQQNAEIFANAFRVIDAVARIEKVESKVYNQGFSKTGELKIQLITQKHNDVKVGKVNNEKDSLIGLLVKGTDKILNFVLPDDADPATFDSLKTTHKFSTNTQQKAIKGLAEYTPLIEMLSKDQIVRLANFMGPDFALTFDVENENHVSDLKGELKEKLGNSGLTMGDLLLVALGYRYRDPGFLSELKTLERQGFVFNAALVSKGADFFADDVTLKQDDRFEGDRLEPQKRQAVVNRLPEDGTVIAELNARDAQAELEGLIQEILPKINQAERALGVFLEAVNAEILDMNYVTYFSTWDNLKNLVPRELPQSSLIEFLMGNPDVYSPEGKRELGIRFARSVARQYEIQMLNQAFDKLLVDIEAKTEAEINAKRKLEEEANADDEREREIAEIRAQIKETMKIDEETGEQKPMLDQFALMEYERRHGGAKKTVVQRAEEQVGNLGAQIQQVAQKIEVVRVVGNEQELNDLRDQLRNLNADKERLELELAALRQLQQQRLEVAQLTPEDAYKKAHKVDDMLRQAALQHTPKLEWKDVNQWIRNAEKGNAKLGFILSEAKEKVATYNNSDPEERKNRYGW